MDVEYAKKVGVIFGSIVGVSIAGIVVALVFALSGTESEVSGPDPIEILTSRVAELESELQTARSELATFVVDTREALANPDLEGRSLTLKNEQGEVMFHLADGEHGPEFRMLHHGRDMFSLTVETPGDDDEEAFWLTLYDPLNRPRIRAYTTFSSDGQGSVAGIGATTPSMDEVAMLSSTSDMAGVIVVTRAGVAEFPTAGDYTPNAEQGEPAARR